jgi:hypothetical protein
MYNYWILISAPWKNKNTIRMREFFVGLEHNY